MSTSAFQYTLPVVVALLVLIYLRKGALEKVNNLQGTFLLRMHKLYGIIGWMAVTIGISSLGLPFFAEKFNILLLITVGSIFLLFLSSGLPCLLYYKNHSLKFDERDIEVKNVYGKTSTSLWSDIISISFNPLSGLLTLEAKNGNKIKIHQHLVGLSLFVKMLDRKTHIVSPEIRNLVK